MHQFPIGQIPPRRGHLLYKCGPKNNVLYSKVPRLLLREHLKFRIFIACYFNFYCSYLIVGVNLSARMKGSCGDILMLFICPMKKQTLKMKVSLLIKLNGEAGC